MTRFQWYIRRLAAMTPSEIAWRVHGTLRAAADRHLLARRQQESPLHTLLERGASPDDRGFAVTQVPVGAWAAAAQDPVRTWRDRLLARADRIAQGRLSVFDLVNHDCGRPIDWNRDHKAGVAAPMVFSGDIDYRDFRVTGDCKFVWEPNRHQHLVVLGRAYRASGEVRYAEAVVEQLRSWLDQCPYGVGMAWRSPLELAIRLINWVWAIDLIEPSGALRRELRTRLYGIVRRHLWEISRKYSRGSSANNHRIGEAAGVFIAACYFRSLRGADRWRRQSFRILCQEIARQTSSDGGNREQAIGYHLFVMQFFLLAGLVGRRSGCEFPEAYWTVLRRQCEFLTAMAEGGEHLPMFGDADDGYVLDVSGHPLDPRAWLSVGAAVFDDPRMAAASGDAEPVHWLLDDKALCRLDALRRQAQDVPLESRAFAESGWYLLQSGRRNSPDRTSVLFDCGDLGFGSLAAHGHADALSFVLRAFGADVLVDPGTYDYFSYPLWRTYFRSTRAHNTIEVDGQDQSIMLGPFLWGRRAKARCLAWTHTAAGGRVCGEHDGYRRLADPVVHRRTLELDGAQRVLRVDDELLCAGEHTVRVCFHVAEQCSVRAVDAHTCEIGAGSGHVRLRIDPQLEVRMYEGTCEPIAGWVSRGYHRRAQGTTLIGSCRIRGSTRLFHSIVLMPPCSAGPGGAGHDGASGRSVADALEAGG